MKGIKLCGECANYSYKKHKCLLGCNKGTDPRSKFYDDCPLPSFTHCTSKSRKLCGRWMTRGSGLIFARHAVIRTRGIDTATAAGSA